MRKLVLVSAIGGLAMALGCSTTHTLALQSSDLSPASRGEVKVKPEGPNTQVSVNVKHLAPPNRMSPDAVTYVVWARPLNASSQPQNLGALKVNDNQEGRLQTITPFRTFELFVTAEPTGLADSPTGDHVVYTRVVERS